MTPTPDLGSHLLPSQRAALERAGVPVVSPEGAPVSDAAWAADEVTRLRRVLADVATTVPDETLRAREPAPCPGCAGDLAGLVDSVCPTCRAALTVAFAPPPADTDARCSRCQDTGLLHTDGRTYVCACGIGRCPCCLSSPVPPDQSPVGNPSTSPSAVAGAPPPRRPVADRHLYASDAEDNHEDPWTNGWDPLICDAATGAREYAEEYGLDVGDHVYVIEASEAREADTDAPEADGWPLDVHRTWHFVVTVANDDGCAVEEVPRG